MTNDGTEVAILRTSEHQQTVAPTYKLMPVQAKDRAFEARMVVLEALQRALFLDIDPDEVHRIVDEELERLIAEQHEPQ